MPTNRLFQLGSRVANTLFGKPWGIPRPQDGTGTTTQPEPQRPDPTKVVPISDDDPLELLQQAGDDIEDCALAAT